MHYQAHDVFCTGRYGLDNGLVVLPNVLKGLQFISWSKAEAEVKTNGSQDFAGSK